MWWLQLEYYIQRKVILSNVKIQKEKTQIHHQEKFSNTWFSVSYAGCSEMTKKPSKEAYFMCRNIHLILRLIFIMAQNFDHVRLKRRLWLRKLHNIEFNYFSNVEPSRASSTNDQDFETFQNPAISKSYAYDFTWIMPRSMSFLSHLKIPNRNLDV